jgi:hypothetical protein
MSSNFPLGHRAEVLVILVLVFGGNDNVTEVSARTLNGIVTSKMWYAVPRMRPLPQATWSYDGEGLMEAETPTRSDEGDPGPANDYEMPSPTGEENANPPYILSPSSIDELTAESTPFESHGLLCPENDEGLMDGAGSRDFPINSICVSQRQRSSGAFFMGPGRRRQLVDGSRIPHLSDGEDMVSRERNPGACNSFHCYWTPFPGGAFVCVCGSVCL